MKRLLFVFLDGVGLGRPGPHNPFGSVPGGALRRLGGDQNWTRPFSERVTAHHCVRRLDATLGVNGLPQSGTGQATLFTGRNCAQIVGRHFGPYPHSKTHPILDRSGLFRQIGTLSALPPPAFANAFPPQYFNDQSRRRATVTTYCCQSAGVPLRDIHALRAGQAIAADLTGRTWHERLALSVPSRTPSAAAHVLTGVTRRHSLTLFEYFLTDKVGHNRYDASPQRLLSHLSTFFATLLDNMDPTEEAVLITSDHGNLEDTTHTQHTCNPVPLLVWGWAAPYFEHATTLTDVTPNIVAAFGDQG